MTSFGSFVHYTLLWTFHDILVIIFIIDSFVEIVELTYREMNCARTYFKKLRFLIVQKSHQFLIEIVNFI